MNTNEKEQKTAPPAQADYAAFVAVDWADQKHEFCLQVSGQTKKETGTLEQKPEVIGPWVAKLRERFGGRPVAVALEQSRGALIHALLSYDFLVLYPLHPNMVSNFRKAFKSSGCKDDPLDTEQILEILTKHLGLLKPLNPDTEQTRLLSRLVEDRRKLVNLRSKHIEALGAGLKEYFPQALELVSGDLSSRLAHDLLKKWPSFPLFQRARPSTIENFFHAHNVRSSELIARVLQLAQSAQALTTDPAIVEAGRRLAQAYTQLIQSLNENVASYEKRIAKVFDAHPEAHLYRGIPGAGPAMTPRLCAFFGTDRSRFEAATNVQSFTGVAPVTVKSGKSKDVFCRVACPQFDRQTFHEFARLSIAKCQWARNYVDYYAAKGKKYHTIIRALAFKWIRILFRCWQTRTPYNETTYMEALKKRGSIFATLHLKKDA